MNRGGKLLSKLKTLSQAASAGRLGFRIKETMRGTHELQPGHGASGPRPFEFRLTWGPDNVTQWLDRSSDQFLSQSAEGTISVDGLCERAPCHGVLQMDYFREKKIRYELDFDVNGKGYRYVGEKVNIRPWNLPVSHTTCFGTLIERETGQLVSTSVARFLVSMLPGFAASARLSVAEP